MKTVSRTFNLLSKLGMTAVVLLLSQQTMALGTDPGVTVSNTVDVDYEVATVAQSTITSTPVDFLVDRRVNFTVSRLGVGLSPANAGDPTDVFVDFFVTNLSNGTLDFNLAFAQLVTADLDIYGPGTADTGPTTGGPLDIDMAAVRIRVSSAIDPTPGTGDGPDPLLGDPTLIDDLPEDQSIRVRLYATAPGHLTDTDIAGLRLEAIAAAPNAVPLPGDPPEGDPLTETAGADNPAEVNSVFADTGNDNLESERDGFDIASTVLIVTKSVLVIDDFIGGPPGPDEKAIPGAILEYTILLDNTGGAVAATNVSIADTIDANAVFDVDGYGGILNVSFDGGTTFCSADAGDGNGDGCTLTGADLTIAGRDESVGPIVAIDVPALGSVTIQFRVEVSTL